MAGAGGSSGGSAGTGGGGGGGGGGGLVPAVPLDPALMSKCTGSKPIKCTFPVPADGNYNVTIELGSATAASTSQIEVELGRIAVQDVKLAAGAYSQQTVSVNVHNETHDDYTAPDKVLDVVISGDAPALHGIGYAAANIPTLFVVGDSTVCDWAPEKANRGWAQEFSIYLKPGLAVANYADSGDTASSLYPKFVSRMGGIGTMKKGDYIFIQFGHNDQKIASAVTAYKANVMKYITDARNAMATPILFTPVARRGYLNGQSGTPTVAEPGFNGLDQQARELAAAEKVALVDLTALAIKFYGTVNAAPLMNDITHFKAAGAIAISKLVADALKAGTTPTTPIGDFLK
jgi:lysophospholipase L1-like esterase